MHLHVHEALSKRKEAIPQKRGDQKRRALTSSWVMKMKANKNSGTHLLAPWQQTVTIFLQRRHMSHRHCNARITIEGFNKLCDQLRDEPERRKVALTSSHTRRLPAYLEACNTFCSSQAQYPDAEGDVAVDTTS